MDDIETVFNNWRQSFSGEVEGEEGAIQQLNGLTNDDQFSLTLHVETTDLVMDWKYDVFLNDGSDISVRVNYIETYGPTVLWFTLQVNRQFLKWIDEVATPLLTIEPERGNGALNLSVYNEELDDEIDYKIPVSEFSFESVKIADYKYVMPNDCSFSDLKMCLAAYDQNINESGSGRCGALDAVITEQIRAMGFDGEFGGCYGEALTITKVEFHW